MLENQNFNNLPTAEAKLTEVERSLENESSPENIKLANDVIALNKKIFEEFGEADKNWHPEKKVMINVEMLKMDKERYAEYTLLSNVRNQKIETLKRNIKDMDTFIHTLAVQKFVPNARNAFQDVWDNLARDVDVVYDTKKLLELSGGIVH